MCMFPTFRHVVVNNPYFRPFTCLVQCSCGKCVECLNSRVRDWSFRCFCEFKNYHYDECSFVTLTYDEEHRLLHEQNEDWKEDFQKFMKRLRKQVFKKYGKKIRFVCTSEFGELRGRIHRHMLLFGLPYDIQNPLMIEKAWRNGFIKLKTCNPRRIRYCLKYMMNPVVKDKKSEFFFLFSRRPGLGYSELPKIKNYVSKCVDKQGNTPTSYYLNGYMYRLPRYVRERVYDEVQRGQQLEATNRQSHEAIKQLENKYRCYGREKFDQDRMNVVYENARLLNKFKNFDRILMIKVRSHYEYIYESSSHENSEERV